MSTTRRPPRTEPEVPVRLAPRDAPPKPNFERRELEFGDQLVSIVREFTTNMFTSLNKAVTSLRTDLTKYVEKHQEYILHGITKLTNLTNFKLLSLAYLKNVKPNDLVLDEGGCFQLNNLVPGSALDKFRIASIELAEELQQTIVVSSTIHRCNDKRCSLIALLEDAFKSEPEKMLMLVCCQRHHDQLENLPQVDIYSQTSVRVNENDRMHAIYIILVKNGMLVV